MLDREAMVARYAYVVRPCTGTREEIEAWCGENIRHRYAIGSCGDVACEDVIDATLFRMVWG